MSSPSEVKTLVDVKIIRYKPNRKGSLDDMRASTTTKMNLIIYLNNLGGSSVEIVPLFLKTNMFECESFANELLYEH